MIRINKELLMKTFQSKESVEDRFNRIIEFGDETFQQDVVFFLQHDFSVIGNRLEPTREVGVSIYGPRVMVIFSALAPLYEALGENMPRPKKEELDLWLQRLLILKRLQPEDIDQAFQSFAGYSQSWAESIAQMVFRLPDKQWSPVITLAVILCYLDLLPDSLEVQNPEVPRKVYFGDKTAH